MTYNRDSTILTGDRDGNVPIEIICSDRGQHPWTHLGTVKVVGDEVVVNEGAIVDAVADRDQVHCVSLDDRGGVHLRCPRCSPHRHVPWKRGTATRIIAAAEASGVSSLDLSRLS